MTLWVAVTAGGVIVAVVPVPVTETMTVVREVLVEVCVTVVLVNLS